jgi:hypothetical protein
VRRGRELWRQHEQRIRDAMFVLAALAFMALQLLPVSLGLLTLAVRRHEPGAGRHPRARHRPARAVTVAP